MVTDLAQIRTLAGVRVAENRDFRRYLRAHRLPESAFHQIVRDVQQHIDCTVCANCCREMTVNVSGGDMAAIAKYLDISPEEAIGRYTTTQGGEATLRQVEGACVFLDGNLCMIYDVRPRVCAAFPAASSDKRSLGARMASVCDKTSLCPILFNALEAYKALAGYHPSPKRNQH